MKVFIYKVTRKRDTYELKVPARSRIAADDSVAEMKGRLVMKIEFLRTEATLEEKPQRVRVNTGEFKKVHEREPSGLNHWWFRIPGVGLWHTPNSCGYQEAVKQAIVRAHTVDATSIAVVPFHKTTEADLELQGAFAAVAGGRNYG